MSRGRGQRHGVVKRPSGHSGNVVVATGTASLPNSTTDPVVLNLMEELDGLEIVRPGGERGADYWRPRRQDLSRLIGWPMITALEKGELDRARMMAALFHDRLGDEERSLNVIHASASQFEAARDYAAMLPHLMSRGADRPLYLPAGHLTEEPEHDFTASCDQLGPELEKWREAGLLVERRRLAWTQGPGEMGSEPLDLTHTSMASGLRAARAAIREADIDGPLIVTVKVSEEALWEFSGLHEEGDRYEGLQAGVSPWASDVSVVISTEYLVDGRPMRIQFAHGLGFVEVAQDRGAGSTSRRDAYALSMVSRFAADNDMEIMFDEHTVLEIDDSYRVAPWEDPARPESLPVLSEQQLFGSDACAHRNSRWEQNDLEAWLVCDDCFNGAVARVPTHRIPASSLLTREIADEKAYLNARRYWDVVNGRPPEIVGSVADLRDREPPVSMIAADYATGLVAAAARRRPASVREAMNRR